MTELMPQLCFTVLDLFKMALTVMKKCMKCMKKRTVLKMINHNIQYTGC